MDSSQAATTPQIGAKIFFISGRGWYVKSREGMFGPFFLRTQAELELERITRLYQIREARAAQNRPNDACTLDGNMLRA